MKKHWFIPVFLIYFVLCYIAVLNAKNVMPTIKRKSNNAEIGLKLVAYLSTRSKIKQLERDKATYRESIEEELKRCTAAEDGSKTIIAEHAGIEAKASITISRSYRLRDHAPKLLAIHLEPKDLAKVVKKVTIEQIDEVALEALYNSKKLSRSAIQSLYECKESERFTVVDLKEERHGS